MLVHLLSMQDINPEQRLVQGEQKCLRGSTGSLWIVLRAVFVLCAHCFFPIESFNNLAVGHALPSSSCSAACSVSSLAAVVCLCSDRCVWGRITRPG